MGNATFRSIEVMLFRPRMRLAPDYMQEIFAEFENWKQNAFKGRPISSLSYGEIKQLLAWLRKLNNNFQAMMDSRSISTSASQGEKTKALKEIDKIIKILSELKDPTTRSVSSVEQSSTMMISIS